MRQRVVCTRPVPVDLAALIGDVEIVDAPVADAVARVAFLTERIDGAALDATPALKIVANFAVGFDNVDVAAATARGVCVSNTPDVLTEATADLAFGLALAAARRLGEGERLVRAGRWTGWAPDQLLGADVWGRTLGIVGLGRIGAAMARRGRGFAMDVIYADSRLEGPAAGVRSADRDEERRVGRYGGSRAAALAGGTRDAPEAAALGATRVDLDALFARADVVSLHCPLTPATRGLVSAARLARMKPGAILVNTARGALVDEAALADAIAGGRLAGAGLDVFAEEPAIHPALLGLERVVLAPHLGSATTTARRRMGELCASAIRAVLQGAPPPNLVNPEVWGSWRLTVDR